MAIPDFAVKVVFLGALPGGESWSTSFWLSVDHALAQTDLTNTLQEVDTAFAAGGGAYAGLKLVNPAQVTIATLLGYQYQGGTKAAVQAQYASTYVPGSVTADKPNQTALVCSLRTGMPGRSHRGRMYLPFLSGSMGNNGLTSSANVLTIAQGLATSFGTINGSGFGKVCVCSQSRSAMFPINQVIADHVLDTQRRRRDKLVDNAPSKANVSL